MEDTRSVVTHPNWMRISRILVAALSMITPALLADPGDPDPSFSAQFLGPAGTTGRVQNILALPDGKYLVGGTFEWVSGVTRRNLVRLNADGTVDESFDIGPDSPDIRSVERLTSGKFLVSGTFSSFNGFARRFLVRLNETGSVDETFDAHLEADVSTGLISSVNRVAVQPDGKVIVGGIFCISGQTASFGIVRLNADGTLDPSFSTSMDPTAFYGILLQPDGKVIVAGNISIGTPKVYYRLLRLNPDGSVDPSFQLPEDLTVPQSVVLQPDGKVVGTFGEKLIRLAANGEVDSSFVSPTYPGGYFRAIAMQPNGAFVAAGSWGLNFGLVMRFFPNGARDESLNASVSYGSEVDRIVTDSNGRVLIGGRFSTVNGKNKNLFARLVGGELPMAGAGEFNLPWPAYAMREAAGAVSVWVTRSGGNASPVGINYRVEAGTASAEDFSSSSGTLSFAAGETAKAIPIAITDDLLVEADETLVVTLSEPAGGATLGGQSSVTVTIVDDEKPGELNWVKTSSALVEGASQLTLEVSRTKGTSGAVSVDYQISSGSATNGADYVFSNGKLTFADGEILKTVSIQFLSDSLREGYEDLTIELSNPTSGAVVGSSNTSSIVIKDDDMPGALDSAFTVSPPIFPTVERVRAVLELPDGKVLVADSQGPGALRRLNSDGSVDTSFAQPFPGGATVKQIIMQPDGRILLLGSGLQMFSGFGSNIARLNADGSYDQTFNPDFQGYYGEYMALQPDGRIVVLRNNLMIRLLPDGSRDPDFEVTGIEGISGWMYGLALQGDGKIIVHGSFSSFQGASVPGIFRLHPRGERDESFLADPSIRIDFSTATAIAVQPDGKILAGGYFSLTNGRSHRLIRLFPNGLLDPSFQTEDAAGSGGVNFLLLQPDGRIIADGGPIDPANEPPYGSVVVRRNLDGSIDPTFKTLGFEPSTFATLSDAGNLYFSKDIGFGIANSRLVKVISGDIDLLTGGQLGFGWTIYNVSETAAKAKVQVVRKNGNAGAVSVGYTTADGSALDGRDYSSRTGTVTFGPGEIAKSIEIPLIDTAGIDGSRQFTILLNDPASAVLGTPASTTVIINDDESAGRFQFDAASYQVREGGSFTVKVRRTVGTDQRATVDYSASGQSASSGTDFIVASGTLTFEDGEIEKTFTVQAPLDGVLEGDEMFSLALTNVTGGGELGTPSFATVTIQDNDDAGSLKSFALLGENSTITASAKLPDGKVMLAGRFVGGITLVRLLPNGGIDGQFNSVVTEGTIRAIAVQSDGKVVIAGSGLRVPGGASRNVMRLNADGTNDASLDQFTGVSGGSGSLLGDVRAVGAQSDGKIILGGIFTAVNGTARPYLARLLLNGSLDPTFQPEVGFEVLDMVVAEDDTVLFATRPNKLVRLKPDGTVDPLFQAQFSGSWVNDQLSPQCIALDSYDRILVGGYFTSVNGQARLNFARLHPDGTLDTSFDAGSLFAEAPDAIEIQEDGRILVGGYYLHRVGGIVRLHEDGAWDSTFKTQPVLNTLWDHVAGLTAMEQIGLLVFGGFKEIDGTARKNCALLLLGKRPGAFRFETGVSSEIAEDGGSIAVTVRRVGGSEGDAVVEYETESGSALPVNDYVGGSGSLVFEAGETTKTFNVSLADDAKYERAEQFKVKLSNATGSFLPAISQVHEITIQDNDTRFPGAVQFSVPTIAVNEADGVVSITVERVGGADDLISVDYGAISGTARGGRDFEDVVGTLNFEEGVTSQTIEIPLLDGDLAEKPEEFTVVLLNPHFGGALGSPSSISVTITDEDTGTLDLFGGTYAGILQGNDETADGLIQLTVASRGAVSGFIMLGQKRYAFRGRINSDGEIAITIPRRGSTPIELSLSLDVLSPESQQISGTVIGDSALFEVFADRRPYQTKTNPAAAAGQYTLILSRETGDSLPLGHGYAVANITKGGAVRVTGKLADGVAFSSTSNLTKDNRWPLYVPLYAKTGLLSGTMELSYGDSWNCSGQADWFKPARARDKYYREGFYGTVTVSGAAKPSSRFAIPSGSQVEANLFGGGLDSPLGPLALELLPNRTLRGTEGLKLSINSATGIISGQFVHPQTQRTVPIRGIFVPNENRGAGFFLGPESGGAVELTITPSSAP